MAKVEQQGLVAAELEENKILWKHENPESTQIWKFMRDVERRRGLKFETYHDLHHYSITRRLDFWEDCIQLFPLVWSGSYKTVVDPTARIDSIPTWFHGTHWNFAENILYASTPDDHSQRSTHGKEDDKIALVEIREGQTTGRPFTWSQLRSRVALFTAALRVQGIKKGDRVAVIMGNTIETLCIFLSTTAIGALFSSSSTDMGSKGILERLRQIEPKLVFMEDTAVYNRKIIDLREKIKEVMEGMKGARQLQELISVPRFEKPRYIGNLPRVTPLSIFLASAPRGNHTLEFERIGFDEGFLIVYSSGTTGPPKCIVHSVAVLLTAFKEGMLHRNLGPTSTALQFTTTGWIMYLASIQTLMHGAKLIMYDGSPFLPSVDSFLRLAATQGVTHFGTSPRYLAAMQSAGVIPKNIRGLEKLKLVTSTGMVLPPALYNWFYSSSGFPSTVHLGNIAGGTDLAGGFGDCNALLPVYSSGGCQGLSLGMDVRVYDSTILPSDPAPKGKEVPIGEPGDLVAVQPFPNQPIGFWGDSKDHTKYRDAYFNRFDNVWTHGDFVHFHPVTKALIYLGRADGVLNPSGVRFGSAEIYSVLEAPEFAGDIADALCVGRRRKQDTDEVVMLFLKMRPGKNFSQDLVKRIKDAIAKALSRRHVPKFVFETPEIPATVNGKKVELPIKKIVSGEKITVSGTLANPECLKWYEQFALLEEGDAGGFVRSKL